ncbi:hypothetical protein BYT27DRAFT_7219884 [Phlegmacium glaucopus]|nr:hypothetical protein BYT27DRAFT_7219884 [Phlegmacium glaucopus]
MTRRSTILPTAGSDNPSDSENSSEDNNPSPKKKAKTSISQPATSREQRPQTVSSKQAALDDDIAAAQSTKVKNLEKQLSKAKKIAKNVKKVPVNDDISCESEEKDSEDDIGFHTSLLSITPVLKKMKATTKLHQTNLTAEQAALKNPTKLTNRAFLTIARKPTCSPEPQAHELEDLEVDERGVNQTSPSPSCQVMVEPSSGAYMGDRQSSPSSQGGMTSSRTPSMLPVSLKAKKTTAKFQDGAVITKRPKVADYEDTIAALLGLVSTHNAFPDVPLRCQWTLRELSDRMMILIKKQGSRIHGHVLSCVRSQIIATYGFIRKTTAPAVAQNQSLYDKLILKGAFHHKDPNTRSGFAENKIISEILYLAWFEDKASQGPVPTHYFNPISCYIPLYINFCLHEWSTGAFLQASFYEKNVIHTHKIYHVKVATWSNINLIVTTNIGKKLFSRAMHNAGVVNDRVQTELDGRTGETDSELSDALE